jgi:hypothetical protein
MAAAEVIGPTLEGEKRNARKIRIRRARLPGSPGSLPVWAVGTGTTSRPVRRPYEPGGPGSPLWQMAMLLRWHRKTSESRSPWPEGLSRSKCTGPAMRLQTTVDQTLIRGLVTRSDRCSSGGFPMSRARASISYRPLTTCWGSPTVASPPALCTLCCRLSWTPFFLQKHFGIY